MARKKIATFGLILVMALQLLPVKQAVQYFFVDNLIIEEIFHANGNATKNFRLLEEDHFIYDGEHFVAGALRENSTAFYHYAEMLPVFYTSDIQTPPPNTPADSLS
jgi:hypothetical protein